MTSAPRELPRIDYFALGGTIASTPSAGRAGAAPALTAESLLQSVPGIAGRAKIQAVQFLQVPSCEIEFADLLRLTAAITDAVATGARGIVITQGTDTLEETAFFLDCLWTGEVPVVVTGAMRNPSVAGADGPANLQAAIQVALEPAARGCGVLVAFNDEIHAARLVRKMHTASPAAFASPPAGPIGWIAEGRPVIALRPPRQAGFGLPGDAAIPPVALVRLAMGDDGRLLAALPGLGYRGLVLEAYGGGHARVAVRDSLRQLAQAMPVILASRTGAGEVLTGTYSFPASETDLIAMGLIPAGRLDGLKARILLGLCLASGLDREAIRGRFRAWA